jgi:hypothetical protein
MDVEYLGPIGTTPRGEKIQHPSRIEEIDEEDKIQKMYISQNSSQADRETKLSATRTQFTQASLYLKQLSDCLNIRVNKEGWDTYVPWEYRMIGEIKWWMKTIKTNKPRLISTNPTFQAVITMDASPIAWGATFQAVKQNIKINPRKEMEKLSQEEKNLVILSENGKLYCPTNLRNSKWSFTDQLGLKLNQKIQNYCRIAQKKWSNFMKKQTSNLKEMTAVYFASPDNKEIQIQNYYNKDGQYNSDVQHQQKIGGNEPLSYSKEDMEIVRKKLLNIKSSSYSREDKCDNRQTESVRNEWGLSAEGRNISKNSEDVAVLSKNRSFRIQKKQINKDIHLGNFLFGFFFYLFSYCFYLFHLSYYYSGYVK